MDVAAGRLAGQWTAVSGGSKGINFAEGFLAAGANVAIAARSAEGLAQVRDLLVEKAGAVHRVETHVLDISEEETIDAFFGRLR